MELITSVIDFVIVSSDIVEHVELIHIDDERINVLTKNVKTKKGTDINKSDRTMIETKINFKWSPKMAI